MPSSILNEPTLGEILATAAATSPFNAEVLEKDLWVVWTLQALFANPGFGRLLGFKGGTSLSKVYGAITRFSEDGTHRHQLPAGRPTRSRRPVRAPRRNAPGRPRSPDVLGEGHRRPLFRHPPTGCVSLRERGSTEPPLVRPRRTPRRSTRCVERLDLRDAVVNLKSLLFVMADVDYTDCQRGKTRLVPDGSLLKELRDDYEAMRAQGMFRSDDPPPSFPDLIHRLGALEAELNSI